MRYFTGSQWSSVRSDVTCSRFDFFQDKSAALLWILCPDNPAVEWEVSVECPRIKPSTPHVFVRAVRQECSRGLARKASALLTPAIPWWHEMPVCCLPQHHKGGTEGQCVAYPGNTRVARKASALLTPAIQGWHGRPVRCLPRQYKGGCQPHVNLCGGSTQRLLSC